MNKIWTTATSLSSVALLATLGACFGGSPTVKPSSASVGSPMSNYCASSDPCPGMSKAKFEVCGSCDPTTRYFRHAMCSLDEKLRKAIDSCMQGQASLSVKGKDIFGAKVSGCVKQRLENEPQMLDAFTSIAKKHKANESEQTAWRVQCDKLWTAHLARKSAGSPTAGAPTPAAKPAAAATAAKP